MTKDELAVRQKSLAELEGAYDEQTKVVREKSALVDAVNKELGATMDFSKAKTLKGDTDEEKADSFEKIMKDHDDACKMQKGIAKRLKAERKAIKAEAKAAREVDKRKNMKYTGINFNPNAGNGKPEDEEQYKGFDWDAIQIPWREKSAKIQGKRAKRNYAIGMFARSLYLKSNLKAQQYATDFMDEHFRTKALAEGFNESGGALVPYEFYPFLVNQVEQYGKLRANMDVWPMKERSMPFVRLVQQNDAGWEDENIQPVESNPTFANLELNAKKLFGWIAVPYELLEDAAIEVGGIMSKSFGWKIAKKEDLAGFTGDGTSTYGKIKGIIPSLRAVDATIANIAGLQVASSNVVGSMTRTDITSMQARIPEYVYDMGTPKFYCNQWVAQNLLRRTAISQSTYATEVINGVPRLLYDGFEVVLVQAMPRTDANSQVCLLFGDPNLAMKMGERRQLTFGTSEHVRFLNDQLVMRVTERVAMTVYEVGSTISDTTVDTPYSPMAGLISAAS